MKTILFNGEEHPQVGELFKVINTYEIHDGCYGPQKVVMLEKMKSVTVIDKELFEQRYGYGQCLSRVEHNETTL